MTRSKKAIPATGRVEKKTAFESLKTLVNLHKHIHDRKIIC